jgi:hypothetical protein
MLLAPARVCASGSSNTVNAKARPSGHFIFFAPTQKINGGAAVDLFLLSFARAYQIILVFSSPV